MTLFAAAVPRKWTFGPVACRAWILGRMWIAAATSWASFAALFDRFLAIVAPRPYNRWTGNGNTALRNSPGRARGVVIGLAVMATWLAAGASLLPTALSINRPEFVLEEVKSCI